MDQKPQGGIWIVLLFFTFTFSEIFCMHHPILNKRSNFITYIIIWVLIAIVHASVLWLVYQIEPVYAVAHAFVHNALFALLGLSIWYMVVQNTSLSMPELTAIINHLGGAALAIIFWIAMSNLILDTIFPGNGFGNHFQQGDVAWRAITGLFYYAAISLMYYLIAAYQNLKDRLEKEADLKALLRETELRALKSQINPHFLFNSLNSISALTFNQAEKAREMTIKLSDFMRYTLKSRDTQLTPLNQEIENIKKYLDIEKIRFGSKLHVRIDVEMACHDYPVPHLILQPLIENAIKHGVYETVETNTLLITCKQVGQHLKISIKNDVDPDFRPRPGEGLGIKNVQNRLTAQYGENAALMHKFEKNQYVVTLLIPVEHHE
ncbi:MAG: sensor histidine kinase [Bacteroidota bacterium]